MARTTRDILPEAEYLTAKYTNVTGFVTPSMLDALVEAIGADSDASSESWARVLGGLIQDTRSILSR